MPGDVSGNGDSGKMDRPSMNWSFGVAGMMVGGMMVGGCCGGGGGGDAVLVRVVWEVLDEKKLLNLVLSERSRAGAEL